MNLRFESESKSGVRRQHGPEIVANSTPNPPLQFNLHRAAGNQALQDLLREGRIQARLTVGDIDDCAEREAEQIATRVLGSEVADDLPARNSEGRTIHRAPSTGNSLIDAPRIVERLLESGGRPLDQESRAFFEPRFGRDLNDVRIHTGAEAAESARSINALAYTAGSDIVFGQGRYSPHTEDGKRLLAHELAHTIQQSSRAPTIIRRTPDLGGLTVSVTHAGTGIPFSGVKVHIDQKLVSSPMSIDLVTDGSGNTPPVQLEQGNYTITISYKCCEQTQDVHVSGNVDQISFFELGLCECGVSSSDQNRDGTIASADSNAPAPDAQANA
jgi:hypothetical protein